MMVHTDSLNELFAALAKAQGVMEAPKYNKEVKVRSEKGAYSYKYADLAAIIDSYRKPLSDNGLAITGRIVSSEGRFSLIMMLGHISGQYMTSEYPLPPPTRAQEFGAALTYARRYSSATLLGIFAEEDTDAAHVGKANGQEKIEAKIEDKPTGELVSTGQMAKIAARMALVQLPVELFLKEYKIEEPSDLPAQLFNDAMQRLLNYGRKQGIDVLQAEAEAQVQEELGGTTFR